MSDRSSKASWLPSAATALAILSCYGTTALIGLLSLLGVTLVIDEGVWVGAIAIFAALATVAVAMSYRRHRIIGPTVVAALGLGLILWAMFGSYSRVIELVGFVLLIAAALWDWRAGVSRGGAADGISWIEARTLADHLKREPGPVIVDVRGPDEFHGPLGHVANALNFPVGELPNRLMEINPLKDKPVILVCRTDKRSANAAALLRHSGFCDVHVLRGGMEQWKETGLPVERRTGLGQT
ncbi:MAG: MerC family mercury resistance protein [Rhodospirillales bacterium]|nr:MerC family mercury resistance protein [Rhodospirillales bacterium]